MNVLGCQDCERSTGGCGKHALTWTWPVTNHPEQPYKCPVCDGTGLTNRPPGIPGDQPQWTSGDVGPYPCRACVRGVIWR